VGVWAIVCIQKPSQPFVHYARSRLCSAIVHFVRNNCLYFVCWGWSAQALTALATAWYNRCTSSKQQFLT